MFSVRDAVLVVLRTLANLHELLRELVEVVELVHTGMDPIS